MKTYTYELMVTIGDTNMEGNVYWVRFLEWFGKAREMFLVSLLPDVSMPEFLMEKNILIVTCDVELKFLKSGYFTDQVRLEIIAEKIENCSVTLAFKNINKKTGEILNQGKQKLAFVDMTTGRPVRVPAELKEKVREYLQE